MAEAPQRQGYYRADGSVPARYVLRRRSESPADRTDYVLEEPILYVHWDGRRWVVPDPRLRTGGREDDQEVFVTDLASVPKLAAWLVPKDGRHTPAAIVHDAMILSGGERKDYQGDPDTEVDAEDADEIFRAGMHYLGVKFVRRWLMWAAVSVRTLFVEGGWFDRLRLVPLLLLFVFGALAVPDALDVPGDVGVGGWVLTWNAPGVGESSLPGEIARVIGWTLVATAAHSVLWLRRWRFGLVSGAAVPLLAFPLAVPAVAYGAYVVIEEVIAIALLVARELGIAHQPVAASRASKALLRDTGQRQGPRARADRPSADR